MNPAAGHAEAENHLQGQKQERGATQGKDPLCSSIPVSAVYHTCIDYSLAILCVHQGITITVMSLILLWEC
jgi:hypothetical protein